MTDEKHSLATYVSDMLAVEEHMHIPFATQASDDEITAYPVAGPLVTRINALCETHVASLKGCLEALGGHEASGVKSAVTSIEGWFAGAIDKMRKTKTAKSLRDDYTALALCSVSYSMLLATANAFGDMRVAELAQRNLRDYAQAIMEIGDAIPNIVTKDLRDLGLDADETMLEATRSQIGEAWRSGAQAQRQTLTGTIEKEAQLNRGSGATYPTA